MIGFIGIKKVFFRLPIYKACINGKTVNDSINDCSDYIQVDDYHLIVKININDDNCFVSETVTKPCIDKAVGESVSTDNIVDKCIDDKTISGPTINI
ncbi:hypothetical protein NDU88_008720 [Pleurodeles waltl]|uniref:Uncharacterized protein n=1 Tax=Pleurodeles waltl TaxID=8319 RepID=A0AAV7NWV9_PLEWA|nr:hypothetical protein NDU88_008720 [Pleurodeles waltl]